MNYAYYCPPAAWRRLRLDTPLAVGFGRVEVWCNGECIWAGDDEHVLLRAFELKAKREPEKDWRVKFFSPLQDRYYQRRPTGGWWLTATGPGFA